MQTSFFPVTSCSLPKCLTRSLISSVSNPPNFLPRNTRTIGGSSTTFLDHWSIDPMCPAFSTEFRFHPEPPRWQRRRWCTKWRSFVASRNRVPSKLPKWVLPSSNRKDRTWWVPYRSERSITKTKKVKVRRQRHGFERDPVSAVLWCDIRGHQSPVWSVANAYLVVVKCSIGRNFALGILLFSFRHFQYRCQHFLGCGFRLQSFDRTGLLHRESVRRRQK